MINADKNLFLQQADNIYAITSGRGSMGKTWLSVTLAQALNLQKQSVLLFDADNGLLNMDFQLASQETYTLQNVVQGDMALNQVVFPINKKKFDMICGLSGSDVLTDMPVGRLQILSDDLKVLAQNYDKVIVDLANSGKVMANLMPAQTNFILVCTSEPSNIVSTYNFLQTVVAGEQYKSLQIVVNYANSYEEGLRTYNTLQRACEQYGRTMPQLLGVIRRDTRVRDSIRSHALLLNKYPNSEAAEDVLNIARKILEMGEKHEKTL